MFSGPIECREVRADDVALRIIPFRRDSRRQTTASSANSQNLDFGILFVEGRGERLAHPGSSGIVEHHFATLGVRDLAASDQHPR